jgi:hypothetical protein
MPKIKISPKYAFPKDGSGKQMGLSMQEKKALTREISKRYQKARRKERAGNRNTRAVL